MIPFHKLRGRARRRCLKLLRRVLGSEHEVYVHRDQSGFRNAKRLHCAGLVTATASRPSWDPDSKYPFRELALFRDAAEAKRRFPSTVMPRRR